MTITGISPVTETGGVALQLDGTEDVNKLVFVVEAEKLTPWIGLVVTLSKILDKSLSEYYTCPIKLPNGAQSQYKLGDELIIAAIAGQMMHGEGRIAGKNIILNDGAYIIPNYEDLLSNMDKTINGVSSEGEEYVSIFY